MVGVAATLDPAHLLHRGKDIAVKLARPDMCLDGDGFDAPGSGDLRVSQSPRQLVNLAAELQRI
ncbi:hypothetical protein C6369_002580 [Rhodococcus rhodochrous]|nr:hypothetical protein C6369_002580 [Rhodococcus rhodochrous]